MSATGYTSEGLLPNEKAIKRKRIEDQQQRFPTDPSSFDTDPRVTFSHVDDAYTISTDKGTWIFDSRNARWVPHLEASDLARQQEAYGSINDGGGANKSQGRTQKKRKTRKETKERQNTAIFATSLPLDTTPAEIHSVFQRAGVVAEELGSGRPRIKMYADDELGKFNGTALIVFFRPESVRLAITLFDEAPFRIGDKNVLSVKEADWSHKSTQQREVATTDDPSKKKKWENADDASKKRLQSKLARMNAKVGEWDDDDPSTLLGTSAAETRMTSTNGTVPDHENLLRGTQDSFNELKYYADGSLDVDSVPPSQRVILKNMFSPSEFSSLSSPSDERNELIEELQEDISNECSSQFGPVLHVEIHDLDPSPAGIVTVLFESEDAARDAILGLDGRYFGGERIEAFGADGTEGYKSSEMDLRRKKRKEAKRLLKKKAKGEATEAQQTGESDDPDDEEAEERRLAEFGNWIEGDDV